jgi:hypothetical protein
MYFGQGNSAEILRRESCARRAGLRFLRVTGLWRGLNPGLKNLGRLAFAEGEINLKIKVRGDGQECPSHTSGSYSRLSPGWRPIRNDKVCLRLTGYSEGKTILGWKRVPATRVAMASRSFWLAKTLTWRARESSGRLTGRPLRMRAAEASSAVTEGN